MLECPYCFRVFRTSPEKIGSRCPKCRMPLFERAAKRRSTERDLGPCPEHPQVPAVAQCNRCDRLVCAVCRTRWHDEPTCPPCVEKSLQVDEPTLQESQRQQRLAWIGLVMAVAGWLTLLLTFWPLSTFHTTPNRFMVYLAGLLFAASFGPALFALGQSTAALRLRGSAQTVASCGLIFAGAQIGLMIGVLLLNLWHN